MWKLILLLFVPGALWAQTSGPLVIDDVNVITMDEAHALSGQQVYIADGRILHIGPPGTGPEDFEGTRVNGQGAYLMPGLAEMHAHVPGRDNGEAYVHDVLNLYLINGITTIRGMLGQAWHLQLREQLASGEITGPDLFTSGPSLNGGSVQSPQQAQQMVRSQKAAGYDFLKLHPGLLKDEYLAVVKTAQELDIPFAGHVSADVGLALTLSSRQATIDHLDGYAQELVPEGHALFSVNPGFFGFNLSPGFQLPDPSTASGCPGSSLMGRAACATAAAQVWNVPTQSLIENLLGEKSVEALLARSGMEFVRESTLLNWTNRVKNTKASTGPGQARSFVLARRALIKQLHDAGAGLLLGSDAPQVMNVPGYAIHDELEYLVASGLSPYEALQTGTVNVARFFKHPDKGYLKKGYRANAVLLKNNPLEDISATREILAVMKNGSWYDASWIAEIKEGIRERKI